MLTVGSSSAGDVSAEQGAGEMGKPRKRVPLIAIPVTLAVGLVVATGYVGNRIMVSRTHVTAVVAASAPVTPPAETATPVVGAATPIVPAVSVAAVPPPAKTDTPHSNPVEEQRETSSLAEPPAAPAVRDAVAPIDGREEAGDDKSGDPLIAPQHGERYLQIAAISASAAQKYLDGLGTRYHLHASVAPGPHDGLVRVLIGPFPDWESVSALKSQIQAMWPDCFVRLY